MTNVNVGEKILICFFRLFLRKKIPHKILLLVGRGHTRYLPLDHGLDGIWWWGIWWLHRHRIPPQLSSCRHLSPKSSLICTSAAEFYPHRQTLSDLGFNCIFISFSCLIRAVPTSSKTAVSLARMSSLGFRSPEDGESSAIISSRNPVNTYNPPHSGLPQTP